MIVLSEEFGLQDLDLSDGSVRNMFDDAFGFNESSIFGFPIENGVRSFEHRDSIVIVGESINDVAAEAERLEASNPTNWLL